MKILSIVGARPQFIKAAAVSRAILQAAQAVQDDPGAPAHGLREVMLHTGQHFDYTMSQVFFDELGIPQPAYNLDIHGGGHGRMTGRMLEAIETVLQDERPDWVLVYGDTNSTLAGALAAAKLHIPVAHVEAGLRSFNRAMPEELNRLLTDHLARILFCPTRTAVANLRAEGIVDAGDTGGAGGGPRVVLCGDVMRDACLLFAGHAKPPAVELPEVFALATAHRAENTDDPARLAGLVASLNAVAGRLPVVFPAHPRTLGRLDEARREGATLELDQRIMVIPTVSYLEMLALLGRCRMVLTDSGGLQKEAFFLRRPCITLREETEWTELVELGVNRLAGVDPQRVLAALNTFESERDELAWDSQPYGSELAGAVIVDWLLRGTGA